MGVQGADLILVEGVWAFGLDLFESFLFGEGPELFRGGGVCGRLDDSLSCLLNQLRHNK